MQAARTVEHASKYCTLYIYAPKGTSNYQFWAENVLKRANELNIPALIVRSGTDNINHTDDNNVITDDDIPF